MKKIISLLASITLIGSSSSNAISCNATPPLSDKTVQKITDVLQFQKYGLNEDSSGEKTFKLYKTQLLSQLNEVLKKYNLPLNVLNLNDISNQKLQLDSKSQKVNVGFNHMDRNNNFDIQVKLGFDAQTITTKLNNTLIDVEQAGGYKDSEPISNYKDKIKETLKNQIIWSSAAEENSYQIVFSDQSKKIIWPTKKTWDSWTPPEYAFNLNIGDDHAKGWIRIEFQYSKQKKELDNPNSGCMKNPIPLTMGAAGNEIKAGDWGKYRVVSDLNDALTPDMLVRSLYPDVSYKPVNINKKTPVLSEMYLPSLGFTQTNPRYFYIQGQ